MSQASDYIYEREQEFFELTGEYPPLKKWGKPKSIPYYIFKINVFEAEKILGIKREPNFWEFMKEYLKNEIEDNSIFDILLESSK